MSNYGKKDERRSYIGMRKHEMHDAARSKHHMYGHTLLRVTIGLLFVVSGFNKLMNPDGVTGMLGGIGFPTPIIFAWILILSELIFGALVLVGFRIKYTAWPLAIVLIVATATVVIPNPQQGWLSTNAFFHYISTAGLISLALTGPGAYAATKR